MQIVQDATDLQRAQDLFKRSFESLPHEIVHTTIGYQSGNFETDVIWVPSINIWGYFGLPPNEKSRGERFWNPFGLDRPPSQVSIVCEINPPRRGLNPATGGVFLSTQGEEMIVAHRCRFTVTGGMSSDYFLARYKGERILPPSGRKRPVLARVAQLQSATFGHDIALFVQEVHRIKELKREQNKERRTRQSRSA